VQQFAVIRALVRAQVGAHTVIYAIRP